MKKISKLMLTALLLAAAGCSDTDESGAKAESSAPEKTEEKTEEKAEETKTVFTQDETITWNEVEYKILSVERSQGEEYFEPKAGKEFVIVHLEIVNNSDEKISYNPYDWEMENSKGQEDSVTFTTVDEDTALDSGDLKPGGSVDGTIVFEEPKGDEGLVLNYYNNLFFDDEPTFSIQLVS